MGYRSDFKIRVWPLEQTKKVATEIELFGTTPYPECDGKLIEIYDAKWYSCSEDLRKISDYILNTFICVTAEGEESKDVWSEVYFNGVQLKSWYLDYTVPDLLTEALREHAN